jgi:outer membrane protein OmpA-like peptidoglycan-associated protein
MPSPKEMAEMEKIADEIEFNLKELIDKELITVTRTNLGLEIEIKSNILFASGVAVLSSQAISPLQKIASILGKAPNDINVEGYTDNVPISTPHFPSNWELSAARAASVVRLFTQSGISPNRLKAIGFAEHKPIADNATELGRSRNRRVAIMVLNKPEEKRFNLGLDKKEQPGALSNDLQKHIPKSIPKPIPLTSLDKRTNDNDSRGGAPTLLQPQTGKPPITTLPLASSQSKASTSATAQIKSAVPSSPKDPTQGSSQFSAQSQSGNSSQSTVIVKPAEPISLPVLQVLPKGKGD